jgi:deoxyribodipyrimidine photo-lyase
MTKDKPILIWLRQDLRLLDNPALAAAAASGAPVIPVYIFDPAHSLGAASRWWLHESLNALDGEFAKRGAPLVLRRGDGTKLIPSLAREFGVQSVFWNRCYDPSAIARDTTLKKKLLDGGLDVRSFNSALLIEPWEIATKGATPFKVFTPFWNALRSHTSFGKPLPAPKTLMGVPGIASDDLDSWTLQPSSPDWARGWRKLWHPGEAGALAQLDKFLDEDVANYATARDFPDVVGTSRLSPFLHWGEISPRVIWNKIEMQMAARRGSAAALTSFARELGWREFCAHLLYHWPTITDKAWKPEFEGMPWRRSKKDFVHWSRGMTGYPIVDAGMRELWQTGFMHNRVRMIVASFLIKDLLIDWRDGAAWFEDTLVDADLASNRANWQWVAGSGADASPFFRIFNPVTQGEKFDADGGYVRRYVPELAALDAKFIHKPWEAPVEVLKLAGIALGKTYPKPMIDHAAARRAALDAYKKIRNEN